MRIVLWRVVLCAAASLAAMLVAGSIACAMSIKMAGKLRVPPKTPLIAVSTDPMIQRVLSQDFEASGRAPGTKAGASVTVTVTVHQNALRPGTSLSDIAPGNPQALALLKAAGVTPPPIADTGSGRSDPFQAMARKQALMPDSSTMQQIRDYQAQGAFTRMPGMPPAPYPPQYQPYQPSPPRGSGSDVYDTAIVARATLNNSSDEMTVVAVAHPGEDFRKARELIAEEIADALLH
jgi:hypothetical protein